MTDFDRFKLYKAKQQVIFVKSQTPQQKSNIIYLILVQPNCQQKIGITKI